MCRPPWLVSSSEPTAFRILPAREVAIAGLGRTPCPNSLKNYTNVTLFRQRSLSGSDWGSLFLWNLRPGTSAGEHSRLVAWADSLYELEPIWEIGAKVRSLAVTPDGSYAVTGGSDDGSVQVWDVKDGTPEGEPHRTGHNGAVRSLAVIPDGTRLVTGGDDGTVRVWDLERDSPVGEPLEGHTNRVTSVAVTPDGSLAVTGSADGTLRVWDLNRQNACWWELFRVQ